MLSQVSTAKTITQYMPALGSCKKHIRFRIFYCLGQVSITICRIPKFAHEERMKQKSSCSVLSVLSNDPSTSQVPVPVPAVYLYLNFQGMIENLKSYLKYVPVLSPCGNVRAKTTVQGDTYTNVLYTVHCTLYSSRGT